MKIPNHESSFKKIQKWKKIEILLDPNSKPQKFFQENPEMEENWNPFGPPKFQTTKVL